MSIQQELDAILHSAAIAPLNDRAFLRVTGSDATRWLNGMVTNSVQALAPGEGCYNFLLNAQGRILADCTIYRDSDSSELTFLLEAQSSQLEAIRQHLDHFIIMDDVELKPLSERAVLLLVGPDAQKLLAAADLTTESLHPGELVEVIWHSSPLSLVRSRNSSVLEYEIGSSRETLEGISESLRSAGATEASAEALEAFRLLEGRPLYGRDITERYLPQETNQPQALHFNKGCYLGQEIVERIRSRGQVHRLLTPLTLTGELPKELPAPLESNGKPVGEITSAAIVPLYSGDQILALGYVRREALDTHAALTYSGGAATPRTGAEVKTAVAASN